MKLLKIVVRLTFKGDKEWKSIPRVWQSEKELKTMNLDLKVFRKGVIVEFDWGIGNFKSIMLTWGKKIGSFSTIPNLN